MSKTTLNRLFFWLPRGLAILLILFISLFALDVFDGSGDWGRILLGLLMHLLPSLVLILALLFAWRWELWGGLVFIALGLAYVGISGGALNWTVWLLIPLPAVVIGGLFIWNFFWRKKQNNA